MYPAFIKDAQQEGNKQAVMSFKNAMAVEKIHHELYTRALEAITASRDLPEADIHVCSICGNTFVGSVPDKCPICGALKDKFMRIK